MPQDSRFVRQSRLQFGRLSFGAAAWLALSCGHLEKGNAHANGIPAPPSLAESFCRQAGVQYSAHRPATNAMVRIPGGTFITDSLNPDQVPRAPVSVESFEMDKTEVTVASFEACVRAKVCWEPQTGGLCNWAKPDSSNHPVNCVTWHHASQYCCWAGKRLPSEQEWEYAASGTDGRLYPWGNDAPESQLCWKRSTSLGTCSVGSYALGASPFGLLDMAGNVWEWTATAEKGHGNTDSFTIRGGSWFFDASWCFRVGVSGRHESMGIADDIGFRCAR